MRITNQILARTAAKSGIPLQQNTLLDIMNKSNSDNNWVSGLKNTSKSNLFGDVKFSKQQEKLKKSADSLRTFATKLNDSGEDSLFAKAQESQSTEELISNIEGMVNSYNTTLENLKGSNGTLDQFYLQELKDAADAKSGELKAIGITRGKDGSLSIDEAALKNADIDSLKSVFGGTSGFTDKIGYIADRVSANADAAKASLSSGYDAGGIMSYFNAFETNKYNFWG